MTGQAACGPAAPTDADEAGGGPSHELLVAMSAEVAAERRPSDVSRGQGPGRDWVPQDALPEGGNQIKCAQGCFAIHEAKACGRVQMPPLLNT